MAFPLVEPRIDFAFAPTVETVTSDSEDIPVLPASPLELLTTYKDNSKDVPLVVGINENEGFLYTASNTLTL